MTTRRKTGFWKAHPLGKAATVLAAFYLILVLAFLYVQALLLSKSDYAPEFFVVLGTACLKFVFFYLLAGKYVFGCLYGAWAGFCCRLKIRSFFLVLLLLFAVVFTGYICTYVYPDWVRNGRFVWGSIRSSTDLVYAPVLCAAGGYILSRAVLHIIRNRPYQ